MTTTRRPIRPKSVEGFISVPPSGRMMSDCADALPAVPVQPADSACFHPVATDGRMYHAEAAVRSGDPVGGTSCCCHLRHQPSPCRYDPALPAAYRCTDAHGSPQGHVHIQ